METKHTPGPWIIETYSVVASNTPVDGGDIICEAQLIFDDSMRRWQANARLIAAAPELLAALKDAREYIRQLLDAMPHEAGDYICNNGERIEDDCYKAIIRAEDH